MKTDAYQIITDRIVKLIEEKQVLPWHMPWRTFKDGSNMPRNLISGKDYRGINVFVLHYGSGFSSPYWLTYKQAQDKGAQVKKGEKGMPVIFWNWFEKEDKDGKKKKLPCLRYYTVFNAEQCENLDFPKSELLELPEQERIDNCENIAGNMPKKPEVTEEGTRAYYQPSDDSVHLPPLRFFDSPECFYSTLFHELGHSTGHEKRLARKGVMDVSFFGSSDYGQEELVAEFCAAYLCGTAGIENKTVNNSASYLDSWLKAIKGNPKMLVQAAAQAQKAADFILGKKLEEEEE